MTAQEACKLSYECGYKYIMERISAATAVGKTWVFLEMHLIEMFYNRLQQDGYKIDIVNNKVEWDESFQ